MQTIQLNQVRDQKPGQFVIQYGPSSRIILSLLLILINHQVKQLYVRMETPCQYN